MGNRSRVDVEEQFWFGGLRGQGELGVAVLFCWGLFLDSVPGTEPTSVHVLVRCSVTGRQHWHRKKDCVIWHRKGNKTKSGQQSRVWESLTMKTTDWTLWSHYKQWGWPQLWAGIKSERVSAQELSVCFLSGENSSFPTSNPGAELLRYPTEYLRVKSKTQHRVGKKILIK